VNLPAEDDGRDIQPMEQIAATAWKDRKPEPSKRLDLVEKRDVFLSLIRNAVAKSTQKKLPSITRLDITFDLTSESVPHVWVTLYAHRYF